MKLINYCYVLELEKEKIYVGYSTALNQRLRNHFFPKEEDKRPAWILKYKPLALIYVISGGTIQLENMLTLAYMNLLGWENVRGGQWCTPNMNFPPPPLQHFSVTALNSLPSLGSPCILEETYLKQDRFLKSLEEQSPGPESWDYCKYN